MTAKPLDRMSPSSIRDEIKCYILSYAGAVSAVTPPAVMRLTDMETPGIQHTCFIKWC